MKAATSSSKVVFLDRATLSPQTVLRPLSFEHDLVLFDSTEPSQVAARIHDADIVITNKVRIDIESLTGAKNLKLVAVAATGTDVVNLAACEQRGITVSNIRHYAVNTVPEHTFALIFALRRSLVAYRDAVNTGRWQESGQFCFFDFPIRDLHGATLGIIGDGALGRAVATIGTALGLNVRFAAYKGRDDMGPLYTPFDEVLRTSDILTLHCPLTPQTRDLIGAQEFELMERRPLLINTARGGLVNEAALVDALMNGRIAGAGFDVVTQEPPLADHPFHRLAGAPNFILTPHVAWASEEAVQALADQLIDNVEAFWRGQPRNVVSV
jgi:glycerate dehydrogenase